VPFLNGDRLAEGVQRVADRLRILAGQRDLVRQAVLWAAANWLLDASCLFVFIVALHGYVSPINLLVAYGLANILAVIPITPGGLGIIEGILIPALHGFGVPLDVAGPAVLGYRVVNFWLPIPAGGVSYMSLRFESVGWRQRLTKAREEIVEQPLDPSANGTKPAAPHPGDADTGPPTAALPPGAVPGVVDAPAPDAPDQSPPVPTPPEHGDVASG
jgi:hypothetical protein